MSLPPLSLSRAHSLCLRPRPHPPCCPAIFPNSLPPPLPPPLPLTNAQACEHCARTCVDNGRERRAKAAGEDRCVYRGRGRPCEVLWLRRVRVCAAWSLCTQARRVETERERERERGVWFKRNLIKIHCMIRGLILLAHPRRFKLRCSVSRTFSWM